MKKVLLLAFFVCLLSHSRGQSTDTVQKNKLFSSSFAVKWNPSGFYFGKIGLLGEYNYKKKKSITFNIGIPAKSTIKAKINHEDRDVHMKTFSVMGGYRMYLGKKTMTGFYFEPYLKYVKNDADLIINTDLNNTPTDFATTSSYSGSGLGAQLGEQFMIAKRIVFDLFFLGPEINTAKNDIVMHDITSTTPWDQQDAADAQKKIDENIGKIPIIGKHISAKVDASNKTVSSHFSGLLPGIRFGLSVGIRFS